MCYEVSAEKILTWALIKQRNGVSIYDIKRLSNAIQNNRDCDFDIDIEAKSLWATVEESEVFKWKDDETIVFTNEYIDKIDKMKECLEYTTPKKINKVLSDSYI